MHSNGMNGSRGTYRRSFLSQPAMIALALAGLLAGLVAPVPADHAGTMTRLPAGYIGGHPVTERREIAGSDLRRTAILIGDSQSVGAGSWPQIALRNHGYSVVFAGAGGTGFVAANPLTGAANYYDAFASNTWTLPPGDPALVVVEGGGNDAASGASDGDILASANALVLGLRRMYPSSRFLLIGTLSRSAEDGGGRRNEVDALLGDFARKRGIPFIAAGEWLTSHNLEAYLADRVHLSQEGHQRAAVVLERSLSALRLGTDHTAVDPSTLRSRVNQPLE